MLSLHEIFEIVGTQLTETDIEALSFLLDETFPGRHPLDPAGWVAEVGQEDPANAGEPPAPALLNAWRRIEPRGSLCPIAARHRPKSGTELLLELERRGYLSEESLEPLLQLLRVLTRHDLLHLVSRKKRRTDFSPPIPEPARKKRKRKAHAWGRTKGQKPAPPPEKVSCGKNCLHIFSAFLFIRVLAFWSSVASTPPFVALTPSCLHSSNLLCSVLT
jgi:hypothetical protein